ncbi:hypothetical protein OEZ85_012492 [Tetradesmus obliquus]|uniref:Uncharacterized protein n=1 Tax=Tetradesmus obliquus TaxID=3088 RepID=A0ABY8TTK8_TETOB|nr:hypothetical protein OEZ85_012492 [Tetradesmus obliquus]
MGNSRCPDAATSGFYNKLSFGWMNNVVKKARQGDVDVHELPLPTPQTADVAYEEFQVRWDAAVKEGRPNLRKVLWSTFGKDLMIAGLFKLVWSVCVIGGVFFFIRSLLQFVNNEGWAAGRTNGWILTATFFFDAWLLGIMLQRMGYGCMTVGIRIRAALCNAVCKKCFNMATINKDMASDAVSFMAADIGKIFDGCQEIHYLWTAPIEAGAILTILAILVKVYSLPGWGVIMIVMPCQYFFGWKIIQNKVKNSKNTQARGGMIQEILPAMKLVKYYAWEQFFEQEITKIRKEEMKLHWKNANIKTINITMVFGTPPVAACVIFAAYELMVGRLAATLAFTSLSLFNILRFPLVVLPKALRALSEALASIARIEEFMLQHVPTDAEGISRSSRAGVKISNAQFKHHGKDNFTLNVPEFSVRSGELVAVVGRVGAGKSSLFHAILGNMQPLAGAAETGGKVSFVPQNPWCQNLTLRDNICFGLPMDEERYSRVIHDCALELDLQILPKGDQSKAGLRGINLSGGQRQRLNLARAAYFNGDLVLLDNALSAVDHHTAHHIFKNLLKDSMSDKAIVLITHQVEFLPECDKVAIMDEGNMIYFGPWNSRAQQLLSKVLPTSHLLAAAGGAEEKKEAPKKKPSAASSSGLSLSATNIKDQMGKKKDRPTTSLTLGQASRTYIKFGRLGLHILGFTSLVWFLIAQTSRQISDYWIRQWTGDTMFWYRLGRAPFFSAPGQAYVFIYGMLTLAFLVFMIFRGHNFHMCALGGAQTMQKRMLHNVLYAPLGFFLQNPVGDMLVAFTKDQDILDENLMDTLHYLGIYGLIMLSTIITVSVTIPHFAAFGGTLFIVTIIMLRYYLPAATTLKKQRAETAGDLVGLVAETLEGLPIITAFNQNKYFVATAANKIDEHHRALFNAESLNLWLAFYCDLYGAILVLAVCIFAVVMRDILGPAAVGLAFSNTIQMLVFYTWSVRFTADAISMMSSTEKVGWLATKTPLEGDALYNADGPSKDAGDAGKQIVKVAAGENGGAPAGWPRRGTVEFDNVWMKYLPSAPYALKGVSFRLNHADKAGVVGRTGSGKSTLLLALYRMFELDKGTIKVDGVDVASLALRKLRTSLSIIPQEPVVFSGTVRTNLDPFNEFSDTAMWEVIKKAGLEGQVRGAGGLDGKVDGTGGQAWSLGQQQLVCLCRAALRNVPVLCLDEATAAMDPHTEQEVQAVIKRVFQDRTTLTIAHRLDTVIESDQVLVMEAGVLKEMAPPSLLLGDRESMFSKLVDKQSPEAAAGLRQMAAAYFATRQGR